MAKAYTRGAKRRIKKAALPELASIPKRQPNGDMRERSDAPRDPRKTALDARCRHFGIDATRTNRKAMGATHMGTQIGMALEASSLPAHEVARRWGALTGLIRAETAYQRHYIGQGEYPRSAAMQVVRDVIEADMDARPDLRTDEEKAESAVRAWMIWQGHLGRLNRAERIALDAAKRDTVDLFKDGQATAPGVRAVLALRRLADASEPGSVSV